MGAESGSGSGSIAGTLARLDGGIDSGRSYQGTDSGTPDPIDAGNPSSCGGTRQLGLCWYLADADTSCSSECAYKGGFDNRALGYIGTPSQGGSLSECAQVLAALGRQGSVAEATQQIGLGCHVWNNGDLWWLQSPAFSASTATPKGTGAQIACACQH